MGDPRENTAWAASRAAGHAILAAGEDRPSLQILVVRSAERFERLGLELSKRSHHLGDRNPSEFRLPPATTGVKILPGNSIILSS